MKKCDRGARLCGIRFRGARFHRVKVVAPITLTVNFYRFTVLLLHCLIVASFHSLDFDAHEKCVRQLCSFADTQVFRIPCFCTKSSSQPFFLARLQLPSASVHHASSFTSFKFPFKTSFHRTVLQIHCLEIWVSMGLLIQRLQVWVLARAAADFSSPEFTFCADSYSLSVPPLCYHIGM